MMMLRWRRKVGIVIERETSFEIWSGGIKSTAGLVYVLARSSGGI